jgi:uracil-DNA glycosylase
VAAAAAPSSADYAFIPPIPEAWQAAVGGEASKAYFKSLGRFLAAEAEKKKTIYPPKGEIFTALHLCKPDEVRVVILGQDPYHGAGQGHGLAFSVQPGVAVPPSLRNVVKEAMACGECVSKPAHGHLAAWAAQGVLLLNNVLTVEASKADSHKGKGWEQFTDAVVRAVNASSNHHVVFLLWGKPAHVKGASVNRLKVCERARLFRERERGGGAASGKDKSALCA